MTINIIDNFDYEADALISTRRIYDADLCKAWDNDTEGQADGVTYQDMGWMC